jgi:hypothetical protein
VASRSRFLSFVFLAFPLVLVSGYCAGSGLDDVLPDLNSIPGWTPDSPPQNYKGEDLYVYIDGGAEIYHEYGFRRVVVQDYKGRNEESIILEIYEMSGPESAYGIYTFKTSGSGKAVAIGEEGLLEDYYLNFRRGDFLVTLTGLADDPRTIEGLMAIGKAVDANLKDGGERPGLVRALPEETRVPGSIKYFRGRLGLFNSHSFFGSMDFDCREAVKADYAEGFSLYLLQYEDAPEAGRKFRDVFSAAKGTPKFREFQSRGEGEFRFRDDRQEEISVYASGRYLLVVAAVKEPPSLPAFIQSLRNSLDR